jgi:hypothetical protein
MLRGDEIRRGLSGAWRLFMGDRAGLGELDTSHAGFWRSFLVVVLLAPLYTVYFMAERRLILEGLPEGTAFTDGAFALWRTLSVLIDWVALPLVLAFAASPLGFAKDYVPLIVAFNWGAAIIAPVIAIPAILLAAGMIGEGLATILVLVALGFVVRMRYVMARIALDGRAGLAAGIVTLEITLSLVIGQGIASVSGY